MHSAKAKIKKSVEDYIKLQPEEYRVFRMSMEDRKSDLTDERFGVAKGSEMRVLFEMPETLHKMIVNQLDIEELEWFKAGGADRKEGGRWFAVNFPAFRLAEHV